MYVLEKSGTIAVILIASVLLAAALSIVLDPFSIVRIVIALISGIPGA